MLLTNNRASYVRIYPLNARMAAPLCTFWAIQLCLGSMAIVAHAAPES